MTEQDDPTLNTPPILAGKKGLVVGVANERSIAWGLARRAASAGAELAFTYQGEALLKRVQPLAESVGSNLLVPMDVTDEAQVDAAFDAVGKAFGSLDFLVHSIAFAGREDLKGRTLDTSRDGFLMAMEISVYSLLHLVRKVEPMMNEGGSIVTMTYYGSMKTVPNYNVMGIAKASLEASVRYLAGDLGEKNIRINAISAGPIKTLAASGVSGLRSMFSQLAERSPLRRNVDIDDVGSAGLYLLSELSKGVTGEVHYVDAGFSTTAI
ncbi:MAG: enoyl-[acyl-carrier-protein] reductase FabI [Acidobacteria bacterium]|jgi:enoyl-[acyl-carrier protein] reductase I|nr:enoyl-[acyl-carrier-protein] reductase FabI [Acidobacteriota bacterium]|tara:strand:- start:2521 stop:3321 length:801 start_codon:yes stop_codon:yes gene_type:complete